MFTNARSCSSAETSIDEVGKIVTFALPSLRPKLFWLCEVVWIEVVRDSHHCNCSLFFYWDSIQVIIFVCDTSEKLCTWSKISITLFLNHFDVFKILQILIAIVLGLHMLFYFLSNFPFDFWVLRDLINHILSKSRGCIGTG